MVLVNSLFHPVIAGILLAAILAAIMSTADSQLLVLLGPGRRLLQGDPQEACQRSELVWVGRGAVMLIAIIALVLAINPDSTVLGLVSYAWAGFGAAFGPAILLSLYWRDMNRNGALAGIVVGGMTVVVWKQLNGGIFDIYEIVPGFILASVAIVAVSKLTGAPAASVTQTFDNYQKSLDTLD
jgi:sodium/proline symporter